MNSSGSKGEAVSFRMKACWEMGVKECDDKWLLLSGCDGVR